MTTARRCEVIGLDPAGCRKRLEAEPGVDLADPLWQKVPGSLSRPPGAGQKEA